MTTDMTPEQNRETPRLDPIENPSGLKMKLAYWLTKREMGKVITPLKVTLCPLSGKPSAGQSAR